MDGIVHAVSPDWLRVEDDNMVAGIAMPGGVTRSVSLSLCRSVALSLCLSASLYRPPRRRRGGSRRSRQDNEAVIRRGRVGLQAATNVCTEGVFTYTQEAVLHPPTARYLQPAEHACMGVCVRAEGGEESGKDM